jgi:hypothetical protein
MTTWIKVADHSGASLIAAERQRQIDLLGWTPEHDDEQDSGELGYAAAHYIGHALGEDTDVLGPWPWHAHWWKPSDDPVRDLVKAGALIAAEIDRLLRRKVAGGESS